MIYIYVSSESEKISNHLVVRKQSWMNGEASHLIFPESKSVVRHNRPKIFGSLFFRRDSNRCKIFGFPSIRPHSCMSCIQMKNLIFGAIAFSFNKMLDLPIMQQVIAFRWDFLKSLDWEEEANRVVSQIAKFDTPGLLFVGDKSK